jgi:FKBP-type peptidyl-prolyl cis-trans isomerase SlyD
MKIAPNQVVGLTYELNIKNETDEWQLVETASAENPMYFIYGMSGLPEEFETRIATLSVGDSFEFTLAPEEGYGDFDPEAVVELPLDVFMVDGKLQDDILQVGNMIPMTNEDDSRLVGQIVEITNELVVMDFNHPLAGREMAFKGNIIEVRPATAEELDHGHVHGTGGVVH